jgi:hypothetical protein
VAVNNVQGLKEQGIDPIAVGTELSTLFSHMIFYFGFVVRIYKIFRVITMYKQYMNAHFHLQV